MGKNQQDHYLQQQQTTSNGGGGASSGIICEGCSLLIRAFSFKCLFILFLSFSALLSGIFWLLPTYTRNFGFDAKDVIKQSATVHASFRLEKPVSQLIPYIERLEYDIYGEIGLPNTKVAILSMHQSVKPNWTDVVFGVLSNPMNASINPVSLSLLKSSLIELFLKQSNLTLTTSIFGNASIFEILKCPGGLTIIPEQSGSIWQIPEVLFNFTLNNSTSEVLNNVDDLKDELKTGLHLKPDEIVYVKITNLKGSTEAPSVIVQASVLPGFGSLLPQRLKQLAQILTGSSAKNLGLDNSVFGKVKEIRLSSYLEGTLHATAPSPSPSISPELAPSHPPISPPTFEQPPCFNCEVSSPSPSTVTEHPPDPCPYSGFVYHSKLSPNSYSKSPFPPYSSPPSAAPTSHSVSHNTERASDLSPIAEVSHGSKLLQIERRSKRLASQSFALSSTSSAGGDFLREILLQGFCVLLVSFVFLNDITF